MLHYLLFTNAVNTDAIHHTNKIQTRAGDVSVTMTENATQQSVVYIVDDDPLVLTAVKDALESRGYAPRTYTSAMELLNNMLPTDTGVVVTDLQMPAMNGIQLQRALIEKQSSLSVIMLTAYADVPVAVEVMKNGAVTLIEKPFKVDRLTNEVQKAISISERLHRERIRICEAQDAIERLTSEELAVMDCAAKGKPNKSISYELSLSSRTVDRRRQSALRKLGVESVSEFAVIRSTAEDREGLLG